MKSNIYLFKYIAFYAIEFNIIMSRYVISGTVNRI